jgi:hypothetical protein
MRTPPGKALQNIENQPIIGFMYKTWVLIFSLLVFLPSRWVAEGMPKPYSPILPLLPFVALITCGELVLNNPTVSPASGPYCPGSNITISFTGTNLPAGDNINVYWGTTNSYNPFSGGGTQIGTIPISYGCTTCPTIMGVMIDPCNSAADEQNEFMLLGSGCGFNVSNLQINPSVGGSGSNDSIGGASQGCQFAAASSLSGLVSSLQAAGANCSGNIFAAGPGTQHTRWRDCNCIFRCYGSFNCL